MIYDPKNENMPKRVSCLQNTNGFFSGNGVAAAYMDGFWPFCRGTPVNY